MPFQKYLQHDSQDTDLQYDPNQRPPGPGPPVFSNPIQFQMPQFMMFGPPVLAPGGGAEVLPPSMFAGSSGDIASSTWVTNNLLSTRYPDRLAHPNDPSNTLLDPIGVHTQFTETSQSEDADDRPDTNSGFTAYPVVPITSNTPAISIETAEPLYMDSSLSLYSPSVFGLPIYSSSGFDLLSIMARVATRPNPTIKLNAVDMSCSFVVVDVRRFDGPIVYASPSFCSLTGYEEQEILGRNCRFLQSPLGYVQQGEERRFTSPAAVSHLKKCLVAGKECQTKIINYKKDGSAFINLVSVIPVPGGVSNSSEESDQVAYHVGFQVDLTQQPNAILQKLRDGSYSLDYGRNLTARSSNVGQRDRRTNAYSFVVPVSRNFRSLLIDDKFVNSVPISTSTTLNHSAVSSSSGEKSNNTDAYDGNQFLSMLLLESCPDFIHVLSLRGAFLYVAPSIRRVLGYDPEEVVGKSVSDYCHPADLVPLMRELKESSATPSQESRSGFSSQSFPKQVDLLFRIMSKSDGYVWMECRGRLHVEPGKGRKAIILSGRTRKMPKLTWGPIARTGGLVMPSYNGAREEDTCENEFWGVLDHTGTFLFVGAAVKDVLGWAIDDIIGKKLEHFIDRRVTKRGASHHPRQLEVIQDAIKSASIRAGTEFSQVMFDMRKKDGSYTTIIMIVYRSTAGPGKPPEPVICQLKFAESSFQAPILYSATSDVFAELDTVRNTSWQYELQQLKFANQRLLEEVQTLELRARRSHSHKQTSSVTFTTSLHTTKTNEDWATTHYEEPQLDHTQCWEAGPLYKPDA